jgi:hypothetical protein
MSLTRNTREATLHWLSPDVEEDEAPEDADDEPVEPLTGELADAALPKVVVAALGAVPEAVVVPSCAIENDDVNPYGVAVAVGDGDDVLALTATEVVAAGAMVAMGAGAGMLLPLLPALAAVELRAVDVPVDVPVDVAVDVPLPVSTPLVELLVVAPD